MYLDYFIYMIKEEFIQILIIKLIMHALKISFKMNLIHFTLAKNKNLKKMQVITSYILDSLNIHKSKESFKAFRNANHV